MSGSKSSARFIACRNLSRPVEKTQEALSKNNGLTLILALSYGGRTEIIDATRSIAEKVKRGEIEPAEITEQVFSQHLYTRNHPIRTC